MPKIKHIEILSFAKLHALVGFIIGMILGVIYSFGGLIIDIMVTLGWLITQETPGLSHGTFLAFGALLGMPAIFTVIGFILGIVIAILYNLFAKYFGGIEIDFKKTKSK